MSDSEDLKKIDEIIKKHKIEAGDPDDELEYAEFIDYNDQDEINELEDYEIPDFQKPDITQFSTYVPTHFLTDEEKRIIESCRDPELKQLLLLNRNKNIQLIDLYSKVKDLLVECQKNINSKKDFINSTKNTKRVCNKIWRLGIPYFKTKDDFPCPRNEDIIRKHNNGELFFYEMTPSNKWLEKDMNRLLKGISFHYKVLKERELEQAIKQLETEMEKDIKKDIEKEELMQELKNKLIDLTHTETDIYPPLNENNCLDWNRISEMFLKEKFSAQDCQIFWSIYLHPSVNKGSWCEAENQRLKTLVVDYNFQNWELIAAELGNNRTGFVACVHYFCKINPVRLGRFTEAEDQLLFNLVEKYKQGDYVPWTKIAHHFTHRTRGQLFNRYKYFLSCRKGQVKGKFTEAEDVLILVLVDRFGKKFTKCAEYFPHRSVVQIKARYSSNLRGYLKRGSFTEDEDKMILDHIGYHGTSNWEPLVNRLDRCGGQIRQRYRTLVAFFKMHPDGEIQNAPRRKYLGTYSSSEYHFLRHMADKFKDFQEIPTLQDIENLLTKNRSSNLNPDLNGPKAKSKLTHKLRVRTVEELTKTTPQTSTKEKCKERKMLPPKSRPRIPKNRLLLVEQPEEVIDCDEPFINVKLSVDDLLVDFFSSSIKLNLKQNINEVHIRQATNTISWVLSSLQVQLAIPKNFKKDQRLDAIDMEILTNLTRDSFFIHRNSTNIDWLIPPNLNTVVGIRALIIRNQIYKSQRKEKKTHIFEKLNTDLKGKQVQWCINNHLSNQSDHTQNEIIAERNMFFQRFVALYKIPSIMTLQGPSEQLDICSTNLRDQFTGQLRTYKKRSGPVQTSDPILFEGVFIKQRSGPVQTSDPTSFEGVFIKQQPYEEECEIDAKPKLEEPPGPKLTMVERLKKRIQETLLDLSKAPPKKKFYKDTLEVMPKTTYSYSDNCPESTQTIVISDDIDTPVETKQAERTQDLNPVDPLKEAKINFMAKRPDRLKRKIRENLVDLTKAPPKKKFYKDTLEIMPKTTCSYADNCPKSPQTVDIDTSVETKQSEKKQDLNPVEPPKKAKKNYMSKQKVNLVEPPKETNKWYMPKQELTLAAPPKQTKKTYKSKQGLKSKQDLNPVEAPKKTKPKRKLKATSTDQKKLKKSMVKSESSVPIKIEKCTNLYPSELETHSSFNPGKGELVLENDSPCSNVSAGSFVDQDLLDLDALNRVLKKEKNFVEESFDF